MKKRAYHNPKRIGIGIPFDNDSSRIDNIASASQDNFDALERQINDIIASMNKGKGGS